MDIIGAKNTDEAMHGAAGSGSGGADIPRPQPGGHGPSITPPPWGGTRPGPLGAPKQAKAPDAGGPAKGPGGSGIVTPTTGGGTNGTYSQSGNAPIRPPSGGITKLKITPTTGSGATGGGDQFELHGGCGGCGGGGTFVQPK